MAASSSSSAEPLPGAAASSSSAAELVPGAAASSSTSTEPLPLAASPDSSGPGHKDFVYMVPTPKWAANPGSLLTNRAVLHAVGEQILARGRALIDPALELLERES